MAGAGDGDFTRALRAALKSLAAFEKFSAEIVALLQRKGYDEVVRAQVLEHLTRKKLVDDARCVELAVRRLAEKGAGPKKIRDTLESRGAPPEVLEAAMPSAMMSPDQILGLLKKKFRSPVPRDKAARFLYSRGFDPEDIEATLDQFTAS